MFFDKKRGIDNELKYAVISGDLDKLLELIDAGIDVDAQDEKGLSVVHYAILNDRLDVLEVLIDTDANINLQDDAGVSPLHLASAYRSVEGVSMLLNANADVSATDSWGLTPLHSAVLHCKECEKSDENSKEIVKKHLATKKSDKIIIAGGYPIDNSKYTNLIEIEEI
jgi:pyruvate kinase